MPCVMWATMHLSVPASRATLEIPSRVVTSCLVSYIVSRLLLSPADLLDCFTQHHRLNSLTNPFAILVSPRPAVPMPNAVSRMVKPSVAASPATSVLHPAAVPSALRTLSARPAWPVSINAVWILVPACVPTMRSVRSATMCPAVSARRVMWVIRLPHANLNHVR